MKSVKCKVKSVKFKVTNVAWGVWGLKLCLLVSCCWLVFCGFISGLGVHFYEILRGYSGGGNNFSKNV